MRLASCSRPLLSCKLAAQSLLQQGVSLQQIVNQLTQTLGSNFLTQLGQQLGFAPGTDAQQMLTQLLNQALGPPANGPPQTPAQQAGDLINRLVQVVGTIGQVSKNAAGQLLESVGKVSDANAGGNPAPGSQVNALLQNALAALQSLAPSNSASLATQTALTNAASSHTSALSAQNSPGSNLQVALAASLNAAQVQANANSTAGSTAPATASAGGNADSAAFTLSQAVAQASDGRTVTANPNLAMVGTGGDTTLGRILARAANNAVGETAQQTALTSNDQATGTALLQQQIAVAAAGASSSSSGSSNDAALMSLLRQLQTALADIPNQKNQTASADSSSGTTASTPSLNSLGILPTIVATTIDPTMQTMQAPAQAQTPAGATGYVDPNGIVDQVLQGISMRNLPDGNQTVSMRLVPESLGNVSVNLQVQNGAVNATLVAQNADVRDMLMANQQMLARSLQDAGLKLASYTVNVSNGGAQNQQPQNQSQPQFGTTRRFTGVITDESDAVAAVPTFGPPQPQLAAMQWLNALA